MSNGIESPISTRPFDEELLQKLFTQHSALQQMWLSGYLYGIATQNPSGTASKGLYPSGALPEEAPYEAKNGIAQKPLVTVLFGSQTGNSQKVAQKTAAKVREQGWEVQIADLNDYPSKQLKEEKIVLMVVSTHGEGEPPVAAEEFYKWLMGTRAPKLAGLQYAVCALGDRSYVQFCQTGIAFDERFSALGATRLAARADCDVDFDDAVEDWIAAVIAHLPTPKESSRVVTDLGRPSNALAPEITPALYSRKQPFDAPLLEKTQLNGRGSSKETWHLEFSLEDSGMIYQPGDSLGIYAQNPLSLVQEVLYAAMLNGNKPLVFNGQENTLRYFLQNEVELTVLTREVIEKYANWTNNTPLKNLLNDPEALKTFLWGQNVADLIRAFPAAMSEETLLSFLRKMPPRLYSIASSLEAHPGEVHLTVAAVRYQHLGRPHLGAASTFLADQVGLGATVPVFVEQNAYFKLPTDDSADIIMVGPGTGVAPFRSFVAERTERSARGKNWLFFGNPHFETDFLYQTEWLNHLKRGTLDRLDVAFSRDQKHKIYVQNRLLERSKLIFERLENGAYFYVCGDKTHMANDVQQALLQIIAQTSGKGDEYALEYLKNLKKQRRYLEDVY